MMMKIAVVILFGDPAWTKGPFAGYDPQSLHTPAFRGATKFRCKPVRAASQSIAWDGQLQEALGYLKTGVGFRRASFCFHWLERECNVGFISLPVSNVASKPEIVVQVPSTPPLTAERSYTTHVLRTGNDQGRACSKHCNQRGGTKVMGRAPRWAGSDELELTHGQKPAGCWPHLLSPVLWLL